MARPGWSSTALRAANRPREAGGAQGTLAREARPGGVPPAHPLPRRGRGRAPPAARGRSTGDTGGGGSAGRARPGCPSAALGALCPLPSPQTHSGHPARARRGCEGGRGGDPEGRGHGYRLTCVSPFPPFTEFHHRERHTGGGDSLGKRVATQMAARCPQWRQGARTHLPCSERGPPLSTNAFSVPSLYPALIGGARKEKHPWGKEEHVGREWGREVRPTPPTMPRRPWANGD